MTVSVFRRLMTSLFQGTVVETPAILARPEDDIQAAQPSLPPRTPFGIPDELTERRLPPGTILPQPQSPGD